MGTYAHHPYACLFPMLGDADIQELADDIAKHGLRQPIVIDVDEKILDGRNRAAACAIAQVDPVFEPFVGNDEEKLAFVVSSNLHRRHLTTSQRASVAAKLLPIYEEQAAKREQNGLKKGSKSPARENLPERENGRARDKAGASLGVSGKAVDMAAKVHAKAIPEIVAAVDRGEVSVSAAAAVADLSQEEQRIAFQSDEGVSGTASRIRRVKEEPTIFDAKNEFDDGAALSRLSSWLRTEVRRWPVDRRDEALEWIIQIVKEFKRA